MGKRNDFSIVRVLGMLLVLAGIPMFCIFFPIGICMFVVGGLLVIAGD